jgi:hypothetical protein
MIETILERYSSKAKLNITTDASVSERYAVIESNDYGFEFIQDLARAMPDYRFCNLHFLRRWAGAQFLDRGSTHGLYLHRTPCGMHDPFDSLTSLYGVTAVTQGTVAESRPTLKYHKSLADIGVSLAQVRFKGEDDGQPYSRLYVYVETDASGFRSLSSLIAEFRATRTNLLVPAGSQSECSMRLGVLFRYSSTTARRSGRHGVTASLCSTAPSGHLYVTTASPRDARNAKDYAYPARRDPDCCRL